MHKKLFTSWVVATLIAASGIAHAEIIQKDSLKGKLAIAVCSQTEAIDCGGFAGTLQTDVFISGEEFVSQSGTFTSEPQNNLFVTARQFNSCTFEFSAVIGSLPGVAVQHALQSAELQGVVPLRDSETDSPAGSISVDVSVEGFGGVEPAPFVFRLVFDDPEGPTQMISVNNMEKTRAATASGTLSLNGTPLACSFTEARLMSVKNSSRTVEHF
jgi:hypothetical protein